MKTKTDLYTKIVLTVIAVALVAHLLKDISFVTKAQANELDLSALKAEDRSDDEGTVFFIYENSSISTPVAYGSGYINNDDRPKYIITNKKGSVRIR